MCTIDLPRNNFWGSAQTTPTRQKMSCGCILYNIQCFPQTLEINQDKLINKEAKKLIPFASPKCQCLFLVFFSRLGG